MAVIAATPSQAARVTAALFQPRPSRHSPLLPMRIFDARPLNKTICAPVANLTESHLQRPLDCFFHLPTGEWLDR